VLPSTVPASYGARDPVVIDARLALGNALIAAGKFDAADELVANLQSDTRDQDRDRMIRYSLLAADIAAKRGRATQAIAQVEHGGHVVRPMLAA
jgi:thioredoxin-like negative regulator of GroEL